MQQGIAFRPFPFSVTAFRQQRSRSHVAAVLVHPNDREAKDE